MFDMPTWRTQHSRRTRTESTVALHVWTIKLPLLGFHESDYLSLFVSIVCWHQVRSSALELLGSMYHRLGPPMKALVPELRAALQSQVCSNQDDLHE